MERGLPLQSKRQQFSAPLPSHHPPRDPGGDAGLERERHHRQPALASLCIYMSV